MFRRAKAIQVEPCSCGFGDEKVIIKPNGRQPTFDYCPNINKLDNHVDCPSFDALCHEDEPCEPYWRFMRGSIKQVRRWCLMGEIEKVNYFIRPHFLIRTRFNEKVTISFYLEENDTPRTFSFDDALIGHTILIMYPEKHDFADMTTGIRQEDGDLVVIFKCSMETLIKTFGSMIGSPVCFHCEARPSSTTYDLSLEKKENFDECSQPTSANISLKKCLRCGIALYCNKLCQTQHWKDSHKKLCSSMKYLQLLRELDFTTTSVISRKNCPPFSFAV